MERGIKGREKERKWNRKSITHKNEGKWVNWKEKQYESEQTDREETLLKQAIQTENHE
jgi:hypothetical protein